MQKQKKKNHQSILELILKTKIFPQSLPHHQKRTQQKQSIDNNYAKTRLCVNSSFTKLSKMFKCIQKQT